ncbi:MAG: sporulation protein [Deltaproteobacteria bacterium]|nr:sporulation protein [Deltaproteobacteria bacterium]
MGFGASIKRFLGIGGIKVQVACPQQVAKDEGIVGGTVSLQSKSDQHVLTLDVTLFEQYTTGRGDNKETEEFELGKVRLAKGFNMKAGETKDVEFELPFKMLKSNADELKEKGGALGKLGSMAKFANAEKSTYSIQADCDVKGTALDPSGKQKIQLL